MKHKLDKKNSKLSSFMEESKPVEINGDKLIFTQQQHFATDRIGIIIGLQGRQKFVLKPVFDFEFHHRNDIHTMTVHDLEFNWKYRG